MSANTNGSSGSGSGHRRSVSVPVGAGQNDYPLLQPESLFYNEDSQRVSNLIDEDIKVRCSQVDLPAQCAHSVVVLLTERVATAAGGKEADDKRYLRTTASPIPLCLYAGYNCFFQ
jgi:hypothetical protein